MFPLGRGSDFAQEPPSPMMMNIFVAAAMLLTAGRGTLPATIAVLGDLRQEVDAMLAQSETLQRQCERLAGCPVYVRIRRDYCLRDKPYRAHTTIQRTLAGPM